ncbi:MAG: oxidoreductase [Steroidobacteraceae bacterium]
MTPPAAAGCTALLAGASGLVGGECLRLLLDSRRYDRIVVLTRRDLGTAITAQARATQLVCDFDRLDDVAPALRADHVFCALGTTIRKAGSQAGFRKVDFDYPYRLAQLALQQGGRHFSLVSAMGASPSSPFFYSRVKGELEQAVRALGWPSLCILRPSLIGGERRESRPLEQLSARALAFAPASWRPVHARDIAAAMIATAVRSPDGVTVIESRDIPGVATAA